MHPTLALIAGLLAYANLAIRQDHGLTAGDAQRYTDDESVKEVKTISQIRDVDEEIFEIIKVPIVEIMEGCRLTKFSKTFLTFVMLNTKVDFLKNGVFDQCEGDGIYAAKVVYRSQIEHMLKFYYLFLRFVQEQNDEAANEYELFAELSEDFEYGKAWQAYRKMVSPDAPQEDLLEILRTANPDYSRYSIKQITEKASQFKYKSIIAYANRLFADRKDVNSDYLAKFIPEYSELSSFAHGGPMATNFVLRNHNDKKRMEESIHTCQMAFQSSLLVKKLTFTAAVVLDKKHGQVVHAIDLVLNSDRAK